MAMTRTPLPTGYLRDAKPGEWPGRQTPEGFRLVVVDALQYEGSDWLPATAGVRCQFTVGPGHQRCGRPAVVTLARGHARPQRWGYCNLRAHLYGRRWINGRLELAVAVPEETP